MHIYSYPVSVSEFRHGLAGFSASGSHLATVQMLDELKVSSEV